ncbi:hypothetical protein TRFO_39993 [Tritrichomonas foetus]|uniref:Rab-GAP TBC domain-containing protein n=1 Tax=Tritrichomonas foetus TaxID=1144522 RepID=A0A1J4J8J9_9EUKA|nr:hypothetical protein TRFO_39993 [Tritrichomonas foetus]|eukprot:OHS93725.1 hypothetical protein TRFO_39993 [Tritrichomonas foetus]
MYRIVSFLIDTSIIIESNNEENLFYLKDGGLSDRKSISVEIFYMFSELYDRYFDPNGSKYVFCDEQQITTGVNEILKEHSPSTLQLLQSFKINHYDFVFPFVRSFFISGRIPTDGEYLFTAFIASKDPIKHAQCMIATSFILLHGRLSSIPLNQIDMFKEIYMALMMKLEVRLLLNNSDVLEKTLEEVELDDDNNDED